MRVLKPDTARKSRWAEKALGENLCRELAQVALTAGLDVPPAGVTEFRQTAREVASDQVAAPARHAQQPGHETHGRVQDSKQRGLEQGFHGRNGADSRIRTADLLITNQLLYQLS